MSAPIERHIGVERSGYHPHGGYYSVIDHEPIPYVTADVRIREAAARMGLRIYNADLETFSTKADRRYPFNQQPDPRKAILDLPIVRMSQSRY